MNNPVIIIGIEHFNTLGTVRSFGVNGIKPIGLLVGHPSKNNVTAASKYWSKLKFFDTFNDVIKYVIDTKENYKEKLVIVPSADAAAYLLDVNYDTISNYYYISSINGKQGRIAEFMNKFVQYKWATQNGIKTAKTWTLEISDNLATVIL